jgi:hypothetical protein
MSKFLQKRYYRTIIFAFGFAVYGFMGWNHAPPYALAIVATATVIGEIYA